MENSHEHSTTNLILLLSVVGQHKGQLVENIHVYIYICATWIPLAHTLGVPSSCPWIPVSPVAGTCTEPLHCSPTPVAGTDPLAHMHQHTDTQTHTHFGSLQELGFHAQSIHQLVLDLCSPLVASGTDGQTHTQTHMHLS